MIEPKMLSFPLFPEVAKKPPMAPPAPTATAWALFPATLKAELL